MRKSLLALTCLVATAGATQAQIGTLIPDARLPLVTSSPRVTEWQGAGYFQFLGGPIVYTLLVDVTTLGAIGDGTTDCTAAFQAAIAQATAESALGGFTVVSVPSGTYKVTSTLNLSSDMVLKGNGSGNTTITVEIATGNHVVATNKTNIGIEDLRLTSNTANDKVGHTGTFITYHNVQDGYIRGVYTHMSRRNHINIRSGSQNIEVRDCYIHGATNVGGGGNGYGIDLDTGSNLCLFENNVFRGLRHSMVMQTDVHHNVFGYNASFDATRSEVPNDYASEITLHGSWDANRGGPYANLFEGNNVGFTAADNSHGANGNYNLWFRNRADKIGLEIASTTSNQTMVNNFFECDTFVYSAIGLPWKVAGSGHWFKNNQTRKKTLFGSYSTKWYDSQNNSYNADVSYYLTAKPGFFGAAAWPYNALSATNPARVRNSGTITAGWSGYQAAP